MHANLLHAEHLLQYTHTHTHTQTGRRSRWCGRTCWTLFVTSSYGTRYFFYFFMCASQRAHTTLSNSAWIWRLIFITAFHSTVYIYMYTLNFTYMCISLYICMYIYIYIVRVCVFVCVCVCLHTGDCGIHSTFPLRNGLDRTFAFTSARSSSVASAEKKKEHILFWRQHLLRTYATRTPAVLRTNTPPPQEQKAPQENKNCPRRVRVYLDEVHLTYRSRGCSRPSTSVKPSLDTDTQTWQSSEV
jgi:hypothetical protein